MTKNQIDEFFQLMETTTSAKRDTIRTIYLERIGDEIIKYCEKYFYRSSKADFRNDLLRFVIRYARTNKQATDFAIKALSDKSKKVRESAIAIIANSLDRNLITTLNEKKSSLKGNENDVDNAINAIMKQNHNLYYPNYTSWHISTDDLDRHLNHTSYQEDVQLYINKYAPELVSPITSILNEQ